MRTCSIYMQSYMCMKNLCIKYLCMCGMLTYVYQLEILIYVCVRVRVVCACADTLNWPLLCAAKPGKISST